MQIKDEFIIESFQNFEQYSKINPISVRIIDPDLQTELLFYSKKYKYRFIANSLSYYLFLELKKTQRLFLLQQMV